MSQVQSDPWAAFSDPVEDPWSAFSDPAPAAPASFDESSFRQWYKGHAARLDLDPNPDAPEHFYDYRAAFKAGAGPGPDGHWPSAFKLAEHPNRYVDGMDTITGYPVADPWAAFSEESAPAATAGQQRPDAGAMPDRLPFQVQRTAELEQRGMPIVPGMPGMHFPSPQEQEEQRRLAAVRGLLPPQRPVSELNLKFAPPGGGHIVTNPDGSPMGGRVQTIADFPQQQRRSLIDEYGAGLINAIAEMDPETLAARLIGDPEAIAAHREKFSIPGVDVRPSAEGGLGHSVAYGAGSATPALAAGFAVAPAAGGRVAQGLAFGVPGAVPGTAQTMEAAMATHGDRSRAAVEAAMNAGITIGTSLFLNPLSKIIGADKATAAIRNAVTRSVAKRAVGVAGGATGEAGQEFVQQIGTELSEEIIRNRTGLSRELAIDMMMDEGRWYDRLVAALTGGLMGGGIRGVAEAGAAKRDIDRNRQAAEIRDARAFQQAGRTISEEAQTTPIAGDLNTRAPFTQAEPRTHDFTPEGQIRRARAESAADAEAQAAAERARLDAEGERIAAMRDRHAASGMQQRPSSDRQQPSMGTSRLGDALTAARPWRTADELGTEGWDLRDFGTERTDQNSAIDLARAMNEQGGGREYTAYVDAQGQWGVAGRDIGRGKGKSRAPQPAPAAPDALSQMDWPDVQDRARKLGIPIHRVPRRELEALIRAREAGGTVLVSTVATPRPQGGNLATGDAGPDGVSTVETPGVPSVMNPAMERDLRARGYSQPDIDAMTPAEAHRILTPVQSAGPVRTRETVNESALTPAQRTRLGRLDARLAEQTDDAGRQRAAANRDAFVRTLPPSAFRRPSPESPRMIETAPEQPERVAAGTVSTENPNEAASDARRVVDGPIGQRTTGVPADNQGERGASVEARPGSEGGTSDEAAERSPAPARPAQRGEFSKADIERRLIAWRQANAPSRPEAELNEVEAEAAGHDMLSTSFRGPLPGEVRDFLEGRPHLRFQFKANDPRGGGEDSMAALGDEYFRRIENRGMGRVREAAETAESMAGNDPEAAVLAFLHRTLPERQSERGRIEVIDQPAQLPDGTTFSIAGRQFAVMNDGSEVYAFEQADIDPDSDLPTAAMQELYLPAMGSIPIDRGSLVLPPDAGDAAVARPADPKPPQGNQPRQPGLLGEQFGGGITGGQATMAFPEPSRLDKEAKARPAEEDIEGQATFADADAAPPPRWFRPDKHDSAAVTADAMLDQGVDPASVATALQSMANMTAKQASEMVAWRQTRPPQEDAPSRVAELLEPGEPFNAMGATAAPGYEVSKTGKIRPVLRSAADLVGLDSAPADASAKPSRYAFSDPETERRYQEAKKGIGKPALLRILRQGWEWTRNNSVRGALPELPRTRELGEARSAAHQLQRAHAWSQVETENLLSRTVKPLNRDDYDLFTRAVILRDLTKTEGALPFGLDAATAASELAMIESDVAANPRVKAALEYRAQMWNAVKLDYVDAMQSIGINVADRLKREDYYRQQVLHHARLKQMKSGSGKRAPLDRRGFLRQREGSTSDISANYLEAEWEVVAQMLADTERAKALGRIKRRYDIYSRLQSQARQQNIETAFGGPEKYRRYLELRQQLREAQADGDKKLAALIHQQLDPLWVTKREDVQIAAAIGKLNNELGTQQQGRGVPFDLDNETPIASANRVIDNPGDFSEDALIAAKWLLKAIGAKRAKIKELAGDAFVTWEDLKPDTHGSFQPQPGRTVFSAHTVPESVAEALFSDLSKEMGITAADLRKVSVLGSERPPMVIPQEIVSQLEALAEPDRTAALDQAVKWATGQWKRFQLLSPQRVAKYNLRNLSEVEKVIAFNPAALMKVPQAVRDLWKLFSHAENAPASVRDWAQRGGATSLVRINELADVNKLGKFARFIDQQQSIVGKAATLPVKVWRGWWQWAGIVTDFRESILRYASYLSYLESIEKSGGTPRNFGGSNRAEVQGIVDPRDKAFRLSADLLGDYSDVSVFGQGLRSRYIPFWSFQELNARTYIAGIRNIITDARLSYAAGHSVLSKAGAVGGVGAAATMATGRIAISLMALQALAYAFNNLVFPEAEEALSEDIKRRSHVTLGHDSAGNVNYFDRIGTSQDFLEWFGLDVGVQDAVDVLRGRRNLREIAEDAWKQPINKVATSISPFISLGISTLSGKKLFPEPMEARTIRDRWEHVFESFALGPEYRALAGKPTRGYGDRLPQLVIYKAEPGRGDYSLIQDRKRGFLKEKGRGIGESRGGRTDAAYYTKLALRYGDRAAAEKYLAEFIALEGTPAGLKQSIRSMHPLHGLNQRDRAEFVATLQPHELRALEKAERYWQDVLVPEGDLLAEIAPKAVERARQAIEKSEGQK